MKVSRMLSLFLFTFCMANGYGQPESLGLTGKWRLGEPIVLDGVLYDAQGTI